MQKNADERHPVSMQDILLYLNEDCGVSGDCRAVYKDIDTINKILYMLDNAEDGYTIDETMLCIDLSGVSELGSISYCRESAFIKKQHLEWYDGSSPITPWIVSKLEEYAEYYSDSVVDKLYTCNFRFRFCSKSLFLKTVHSAVDGTLDTERAFEELTASYKRLLSRL